MPNSKKTAFVSGKFAVIHSGHIRLFMFAKTLADRLIVALDAEGLDPAEVEWREGFLKTQEFVDEVVIFNSDLVSLIKRLKPDLVLKGSEFEVQFNVEQEAVSSYGGRLVFSSGSTYFSESDLLSSREDGAQGNLQPIPSDYLSRNKISRADLIQQISAFANIRVCVIGDLIIDEYINCHPLGMSREEPTVVVTPIDSRKFLGGAGIVAAHTVGLGAETSFITIVGDDEVATWSVEKAREYGVKMVGITDHKRPTTLKQRYRSGNHTLLKISHLSQEEISKTIREQIVAEFRSIANSVDVLILSDFSYGIFNAETSRALVAIAREHGILITADSQTSSQIGNLAQFEGVDLITPTEVEARQELKDQTSGLAVIAEKLRIKMAPKSILLKLGSDGVLIHGVTSSGDLAPTEALPSLNHNPVDTSGAGDSMLATASLALRVEPNISKAALLGTLAAAIQISRTGNIPLSQSSIISALKE